MTGPVLLVVGAAPRSLGESVVTEATNSPWEFERIVTAGISDEEFHMDITKSGEVKVVLSEVQPDIVVCTVGVNQPCSVGSRYLGLRMADAFRVNVISVIELLNHFGNCAAFGSPSWSGARRFAAISSNSARIPRSGSIAYCASKAALSMALRVAAREYAQDRVAVWGYEPGLLDGTPMTEEISGSFTGPLHRMKGVLSGGLGTAGLARQIVHDVVNPSLAYNGMMIPFDAGEI